jgi:hypothetical protein
MHYALLAVDAGMRLGPEVVRLPFLVGCNSGPRSCLLHLVEEGAAIMVTSTMVPVETQMPLLSRYRFTR